MNSWCSKPTAASAAVRLFWHTAAIVAVMLLAANCRAQATSPPRQAECRILTSESLKPIYDSYPATDILFYPVKGQTAQALRDAMRELGPSDFDGTRRDGFTAWKLEWTWPVRQNALPDYSRVKLESGVTVTLPCWINPQARTALRQNWDKFISAVIRHEARHVSFFAANREIVAQAIKQAGQRNPSFPPAQANRLAHAEVNRIKKLDLELDRETKNGKLEGVVLP